LRFWCCAISWRCCAGRSAAHVFRDRRINSTFAELAKAINPIVVGWMHYYGRFYRSALYPLLVRINTYLVRWIREKYKRLQGTRKASQCLQRIALRHCRMFVHWQWVADAW
jgi:RNA-directed DNA polymerase